MARPFSLSKGKTMNKKPQAKAQSVKVKLACVYSGEGQSWGIGHIIEVDAIEAERLISLGVATGI